MYGKFINDELIEAPNTYKTPMGELITNFTNSIELMKAYGFKEITGNQPDYDPNCEVLIITAHNEHEDNIECTYEKVSMASLLKTTKSNDEKIDYVKGEILDARKSTKITNGVSTVKEYSSLKERLDKMESFIYDRVDIEDTEVNITMEDRKMYVCNNPITSLSLITPANVDVNFSTKLYFETDADLSLDNVLFMGDHCERGKFKGKENNEYIIDFMYSNQLIGVVSSSNGVDGDEGDPSDPGEEDKELHSFSGADALITIARTYFLNRTKYTTYGNNNILTDEGALSWTKATRKGADSPDGRYRAVDCSAFVGLCMRGIEFDDVFKTSDVYNKKDLNPRTNKYPWATKLSRTAADMCKDCEDLGWALSPDKWHTDEAKTNWLGLEKGDLIFFKKDEPNDRYKNVGHVAIYYGDNSKGEKCVIEFTGSTGVKKHSDGKTCGCQIIQFDRKNRNNVITVARCQN